MTPESHSDPEPGLRQVAFQDFRSGEVPDSFRRGWRELYFFYLEPSRREELASMGWARRTFLLLGWLFKSLLRKLAPQRRFMLLAALVLFALGWVKLVLFAGIEVRMLAFLILLVLLMLELKDKLLGNMSEEVRTFITEKMEELGPMRLSEVEEIQLRIVQQARQLEEQGKITIVRGDSGNDWV